MRDPFSAIEAALTREFDDLGDVQARIDYGRQARTGVPEVIFGDGKTLEQLGGTCASLLERSQRAIVSRIDADTADQISRRAGDDIRVTWPFPGRTAVLARGESQPPATRAFLAVTTAGTSDLPVAGEAATVAREIGCRVEIVADVGVAG